MNADRTRLVRELTDRDRKPVDMARVVAGLFQVDSAVRRYRYLQSHPTTFVPPARRRES